MVRGIPKEMDKQIEMFIPNYVVDHRKSWDMYERHNCDTKDQYWKAEGMRPFGQNSGNVSSPSGKCLAFTVPY